MSPVSEVVISHILSLVSMSEYYEYFRLRVFEGIQTATRTEVGGTIDWQEALT